jgi:DNA invertase Pin-like site-specific DNA recombinase
MTDPKITPRHLARKAILYVRQSSAHQVARNHESRRLQYAMEERLRLLGWREIEVVDEDLGRSAAAFAGQRSGFQHTVAEVCLGNVGAVAAREIARFSRNNKDWAQLIDMCRVLDTLLVDVDVVYDPRRANDRLLLGVKGTLSEYELDLLRIRANDARQEKAARGELLVAVPVGFVKVDGRVEKDPDRRVQNSISSIYSKFLELGSARQALLWFVDRDLEVPVAKHGNRVGAPVVWKRPSYRRFLEVLRNPAYGGAYAYGKTAVVMDAPSGQPRKRSMRKPRDEWSVLIPEHHEGYVTWDVYLRVQKMLSGNSSRTSAPGCGAPKNGSALLAGLLRCHRCGRKLRVAYCGSHGDVPRYQCDRGTMDTAEPRCISFGGTLVDRHIVAEALRVVQPAGIDAAVLAAEQKQSAQDDLLRALELDLKSARYEAARAEKRYESVDSENRLVADELESRWNASLARVRALEQRLETERRQVQPQASVDREELARLAADLEQVWRDPKVDDRTKKRLLRSLIHEIVVDLDGENALILTLHWTGGVHTQLRVARRRRGESAAQTDKDLVEVVRILARIGNDELIAGALNKAGRTTGRGNRWTQERVKALRSHNKIGPYSDDARLREGWMSLKQAALHLRLSAIALRRLAERKLIPSEHPLPNGPWIFRRDDLDQAATRSLADGIRRGRGAVHSPRQLVLGIPTT